MSDYELSPAQEAALDGHIARSDERCGAYSFACQLAEELCAT